VPRSGGSWSHLLHEDPDGTFRVEVIDEDGETFPVARQVTQGQAKKLIERIDREARESNRPVKEVIRDYHFMAATVITVKRLPT
jgi:hypothetical protein